MDKEVLELFEVDCDDDVPCDAGDAQATRAQRARRISAGTSLRRVLAGVL